MATAFTITKYRDPEKLDISVLGKALQFKQGEYDTGVMQTQQLINQYAGTDLLRDVDKQYLGDRLNTIVNYINESGTRGWSNKNIQSNIQSYVSSALDKNVLSAVASTHSYRKQMAEIEDIKKNKPDQYSMQNEWFATRDLQRYLTSGQVGDSYRAQSYVPYTDVNKTILENSKYLKDYGVEYYTTSEGNSYFRKIDTHEKIDPTVARQYVEGIMDTKMMNQLYIDGQYSYKDLPDAHIQEQYNSKLNSYVNYNTDKINELKTLAVSATKEKKAEYQQLISTLEQRNNAINTSKTTDISRDAMISYMHNNNFLDKWTNFFSYDRVKDYQIDDSGFKVWKAEQDIKQANRDFGLKETQFQYQIKKDEAEMALKRDELALKADQNKISGKSAGLIKDSNGEWVIDPSNPNSGLTTSDIPADLKEEATPTPFKEAQAEFYSNVNQLTTAVAGEIKDLLAKENNEELRKQVGSNNPRQIAFMLLNSPSKNKVIYNQLSDNAKQIVDTAISSKSRMTDIDKNLNAIRDDMRKFGTAVISKNTKDSVKSAFKNATAGLTLDASGNVVNGDVLQRNDKFAQAARTIGAINFRLMSGKLSEDETEQLKRIALNELAGTGMSQKQLTSAYDKLIFRKTYNGFWSGLGQVATEFLIGSNQDRTAPTNPLARILKGTQNLVNDLSDSNKKSTFADDIMDYADSAMWNGNRRGATGEISDRLAGFFTANEDTNSIGISDIDTDALGFDPSNMETRWKGQMDAVNQKLIRNKGTTINKSMNIDMSSKTGKVLGGQLKTFFPVGSDVQNDGTARVILNQAEGLASITMGVKDGKVYEPTTVQVKISDLPSAILNSVQQEARTSLYSATNPYAVKYSEETEIPDNKQDWARKVALMPEQQRTEAFNNPPMTKEDILKNLTTIYGNEIVQKNKAQIQEIIDKPITINTVPENGQWTLVANQNGVNILRVPTGQENYNPRLMEKYSNELVTTTILENIKRTISRY